MDKKRVFMIGAGFSTQLTNGRFPTSQNLISQLKKDVSHPCLHRNIQDIPTGDSIQAILSRIDLDNYITNVEKKQLKREISLSFQLQLSLSQWYGTSDNDKNVSRKLVSDLFRPGDVVMNFNWDILLEHLICINHEDHKDHKDSTKQVPV